MLSNKRQKIKTVRTTVLVYVVISFHNHDVARKMRRYTFTCIIFYYEPLGNFVNSRSFIRKKQ